MGLKNGVAVSPYIEKKDPKGMIEFLEEVVLDGLLDTLKLLPFLFLTYLVMETLEHHAAARAERLIRRAGRLGPLFGGLLGLVPQCGFSAAAAGFYAGRIVTVGTLVAVFLSTSDEMLPILLLGGVSFVGVLKILLLKLAVAVSVGFSIDLLLRRRRGAGELSVEQICEREHCHCERGVWLSALRHTMGIALFLFVVTSAINALVFWMGEDAPASLLTAYPYVTLPACALIGLIPNCAASVALAQLYADGLISLGSMLAGLLPGAGVGLLVLFRVNRRLSENLAILAVLVLTGVLFGLIFDLCGLSVLIG